MSGSIHFVAVAAAVAALALSQGCGQPPEEEEAAGSQTAAQSKMPPSPARSGEGARPQAVRSNTLPANFPDDVPIHPKAKDFESRATADMELEITMVVKDDVSEVSSYYADSLAAKGWSTDIKETPDGTAVLADKGVRRVVIMVSEGPRGAEVWMALGGQ